MNEKQPDWFDDDKANTIITNKAASEDALFLSKIKQHSVKDLEEILLIEEEGYDDRLIYAPIPIKKGSFFLNAGDTNTGKTTFFISCIIQAYKNNEKLLVVLTEDDNKEAFKGVPPNFLEQYPGINETYSYMELPSYTDHQFEVLTKHANEHYDVLIFDYIDHASYDSDEKDGNMKYKKLGQLLNINISKASELTTIVNTQTNNPMSSFVAESLMKIGKKKKGDDIYTLDEQLALIARGLSSSKYKGYISGGAEMANRAKTIKINFRLDSFTVLSVIVKEKSRNSKDLMGNMYLDKLNSNTGIIDFIPLDGINNRKYNSTTSYDIAHLLPTGNAMKEERAHDNDNDDDLNTI